MSVGSEYETKLDALLDEYDASIEDLSGCARNASPGMTKACREEIAVSIAQRESLRRGLLRLEDDFERPCFSCACG
jgi:hypothetical protein